MTPKKNRGSAEDLKKVFKQGRSIAGTVLSFRFVQNPSPTPPKVSFVVPKTLTKSAVKRNTLRRRGYAALSSFLDQFPPGLVGAMVFRKGEATKEEIQKDIVNVVKRL